MTQIHASLSSGTAETTTLAALAGVDRPADDDTAGARWLRACAARAEHVATCLAAGEVRAAVVRLHAHEAVEDPGHDVRRVVEDLHVPLHRTHTNSHETLFAAEAALFPVARALLDRLSGEVVPA